MKNTFKIILKDENSSKYTPKDIKLHHYFLNSQDSWGSIPHSKT